MYLLGIFLLELIILFFLSQFLTKSISAILYLFTKSENVTIYLISFLFLPGVIIHEFSHMLMALLLFVPVGHIEFFPKITEHGVKLGSVAVGKTDIFRRALIGFAPVFFGTTLILGFLYYLAFFPSTFLSSIGIKFFTAFYVLFEIGNTMFSSHKDVEGTLELLGVLLIIILALFFVGVKIPEGVLLLLNSESVVKTLQLICLFLLAPIIVDGVLCAVAKIFLRVRY